MASEYVEHVRRWKNGCGSCLCSRASRVVFARGIIPCQAVFVGEAPGDSEDALGQPFVGPAGKLLDYAIFQAWSGRVSHAFYNVLGCIPRDEDGNKMEDPDPADAKVCRPRLIEFLRIARPRLIVAVGDFAKAQVPSPSTLASSGDGQPEWLPPGGRMEYQDIVHPAYVLRLNAVMKDMAIRRTIVRLQDAEARLK